MTDRSGTPAPSRERLDTIIAKWKDWLDRNGFSHAAEPWVSEFVADLKLLRRREKAAALAAVEQPRPLQQHWEMVKSPDASYPEGLWTPYKDMPCVCGHSDMEHSHDDWVCGRAFGETPTCHCTGYRAALDPPSSTQET